MDGRPLICIGTLCKRCVGDTHEQAPRRRLTVLPEGIGVDITSRLPKDAGERIVVMQSSVVRRLQTAPYRIHARLSAVALSSPTFGWISTTHLSK